MILCTTNDARFGPSTVSGSVHVQLFKTKSDSDVLLTLTLTLTMKSGQVSKRQVIFPGFHDDQRVATAWGLNKKAMIQSLGKPSYSQLMIGVSNHLSPITILSFGEWIPRESQQTDCFIHLG